jgi:hypothetical protein
MQLRIFIGPGPLLTSSKIIDQKKYFGIFLMTGLVNAFKLYSSGGSHVEISEDPATSAEFEVLTAVVMKGMIVLFTKLLISSGNNSDLYSGSARFESQPGHRVSWMRFLVAFLSLQANSEIIP